MVEKMQIMLIQEKNSKEIKQKDTELMLISQLMEKSLITMLEN